MEFYLAIYLVLAAFGVASITRSAEVL